MQSLRFACCLLACISKREVSAGHAAGGARVDVGCFRWKSLATNTSFLICSGVPSAKELLFFFFVLSVTKTGVVEIFFFLGNGRVDFEVRIYIGRCCVHTHFEPLAVNGLRHLFFLCTEMCSLLVSIQSKAESS